MYLIYILVHFKMNLELFQILSRTIYLFLLIGPLSANADVGAGELLLSLIACLRPVSQVSQELGIILRENIYMSD